MGDLNSIIEESITGQRVIKAYVREHVVIDEFDATNLALREAATRAQIFGGTMGPLSNFVNNVGFAIVAGAGGWMAVQQIATVGTIVSFVNYARRFTRPLNQIANLYNDGVDIREVKIDDLRRNLGIVLQDTYLFVTTVMENIRYGRLIASDEDVIAAAKLANADPFIRRLPAGYQTELSERGSNLSQGQRQLLAIARALLADPKILVLDEATSSVDTRTEKNIQEAMLRLMEGRTSFVIAHRLSTIREADKILVVNDGEIIERGTHRELLAAQDFYYNLYVSQFKGQRELIPELVGV